MAIDIYGGPTIGDLEYRSGTLLERCVLLNHHVPAWQEGGLRAIVITTTGFGQISKVFAEIAESDGRLRQVRSVTELRSLSRDEFGILLGCEQDTLDQDLDRLHVLAALGAVTFTFSHNRQNLYATGVGELFDGGFTHLGKAALKVLEGLPMLVDLVHLSPKSFWDALSYYPGPVIVSHSNAKAVCGHPRNLTDDQIKAVAERGGVIGMNMYRGYVNDDPAAASIDDVVRHAQHIAGLVGPEHLAMGGDYMEAPMEIMAPALKTVDPDGKQKLDVSIYMTGPKGVADRSQYPNLVAALAQAGFSGPDIEQIMGGAYERCLAQVRP